MYMLELFCCAQWICLVNPKLEQRGGEVGAPYNPCIHRVAIHYIRPTLYEVLSHHPEVRPNMHYPVLVVPWMCRGLVSMPSLGKSPGVSAL